MTLKLIELVRMARENGHRWIAVDKNVFAYSYGLIPTIYDNKFRIDGIEYIYLGEYNLTCDWKGTLIDVDKIKVK